MRSRRLVDACSSSTRVAILCAVLCLPSLVFGATRPSWNLEIGPIVSPFMSGNAGGGPSAPKFSDAFDPGLGFRLEISRPFTDRLAFVVGAEHQTHGGKTFEGFSFGDLDVTPVWIGGRYRLVGASTWRLSVLADLGAARLSAVDVSFVDTTVRYWESSWVSLWDIGTELSFHPSERWGAVLRAAYRTIGKPDAAIGRPSEADSARLLPISLTVRYTF